ncbi:photosystem II BY [Wolffia australiana]
MAASLSTMAMLNARCLAVKSSLSPKLPTFPSSKPISLKKQEATPAAVAAAAGAVFSALSAAEPAMAAQQLAELAEGSDNRGLALLIPLVPAVLWVLYNILQPALNQLNRMRSEKALVAGLGVGAAMAAAGLLAPPGAVAAAAADAAGDNRGLALLIPLVPAVLWVLYNILQPALNQINRMRSG